MSRARPAQSVALSNDTASTYPPAPRRCGPTYSTLTLSNPVAGYFQHASSVAPSSSLLDVSPPSAPVEAFGLHPLAASNQQSPAKFDTASSVRFPCEPSIAACVISPSETDTLPDAFQMRAQSSLCPFLAYCSAFSRAQRGAFYDL